MPTPPASTSANDGTATPGPVTCAGDPFESSRTDREHAGWLDPEPQEESGWSALLAQRFEPRWRHLSWLVPRTLLDGANDQIAKHVYDLVNARRMRWVAAQRVAGVPRNLHAEPVPAAQSEFSFLVVGDPGEADASQYATVDALKAVDDDCAFMVIASDVIYPAGDINDYANAFYLPYEWFRRPILACPGNHDWYDGLDGFMFHFCGAEPLPPMELRASSFTVPERVARRLWRQSSRPERARLLARRRQGMQPGNAPWAPPQPGPYWAIETAHLKIITIDTGITGAIDREQGEWLVRESRGPIAKLLITGKPIYVDNEYRPSWIKWGKDVEDPQQDEFADYANIDDVVRDPAHNYVAAIGGDIHNYQRYNARFVEDDATRTIVYLVSGGGGAFLSDTHSIPKIDLAPADPARGKPPRHTLPEPLCEKDFRCYPLRGDSLAYYALSLVPRLARLAFCLLAVPAATIVALALLGVRAGDGLGPEGDLRLWPASSTVAGTLIAAGVLGVLAWAVMRLVRSKLPISGTFTTIGVVLGGLALTLRALSEWGLWWHELWLVSALTVGTIVAGLLAILVHYYSRGADPRVTDVLFPLLGFGAAITALLGYEPWHSAQRLLTVSGIALLTLVVLVPVTSRLLKHHAARVKSIAYVAGLLLVACGLWSLWDEGRFASAAVVVMGTLPACALLTFLIAGLFMLKPGALWTLGRVLVHPGLWRGDIDPDECATFMSEERGIAPDAIPRYARCEVVSKRTRQLGKLVLATPGISLLADRNEPPFFKSFLKLTVSDDAPLTGPTLTITCYGVTGWAQHADAPPVEDCVRIPLTRR